MIWLILGGAALAYALFHTVRWCIKDFESTLGYDREDLL